MTLRPGIREALWMAAGAAVFLAIAAVVMHFQDDRSPAERSAEKARRAGAAERMLVALGAASEAEKSAVLAVTDEESKAYADAARAAAAEVERERRALEESLKSGGTSAESEALAQFSELFAEVQRIDGGLLDLAVRNTNLKASALAFGPAADAVRDMSAALDRAVGTDTAKRAFVARGAEIGALRVLALLPPHIAEENDARMDEIESRIAAADEAVRADLATLAALPELAGNADVATAASRYAQFGETRKQILALSRENTDVRSLSISLGQKSKAARLCREALRVLRQTIESEPAPGVTRGSATNPR